jgi:hypothetical protein
MVTVHIWNFRGSTQAWGHASLELDRTYVSWWPENPGQVPTKIPNVYASHPFRNRNFASDVDDEGQRPDHSVRINGLDENAIKDWWQGMGLVRDGQEFAGPLLPWKTLDQNCSTVVARALTVGGGEKFASWYKSRSIVWTPASVLQYALSIQAGTTSAPKK